MVDMTKPADNERLVAEIPEWFWWTDNVTVPLGFEKLQKHDASLLQPGMGIAQHERRRVSRNFKVHAYIRYPFQSSTVGQYLVYG